MKIDEKALEAAEKAYRQHIDGRPMVHAIESYEAARAPATGQQAWQPADPEISAQAYWNHKRIKEQPVELAALQKFKDYVHQRLDEAGIPTHPEGEHSKYGCRIGDRLDIALGLSRRESTPPDDLPPLRHNLQYALKLLEGWDGWNANPIHEAREAVKRALQAHKGGVDD